jgi:hypothetical protein
MHAIVKSTPVTVDGAAFVVVENDEGWVFAFRDDGRVNGDGDGALSIIQRDLRRKVMAAYNAA